MSRSVVIWLGHSSPATEDTVHIAVPEGRAAVKRAGWIFFGWGSETRARWADPSVVGSDGRGGQGRPVRAACRGSLDGPGGLVVASHHGVRPPPGGLGCQGGGHSGPHHCARLSWATEARRPAIPSRWCAWCVAATARRAHSNPRPRHLGGGHGVIRARVLAVSEPAHPASRHRQRISPSRSP